MSVVTILVVYYYWEKGQPNIYLGSPKTIFLVVF